MPDPRDDLIRRGDVLDAACVPKADEPWTDWECQFCGETRPEFGGICPNKIQRLPAGGDELAAAAMALLEKSSKALAPRWEIFWDPGRNDGGGYRVLRCQSCNSTYRSTSQEEHAPDCTWSAYRSAVARREAGR